MQTALKRDLLLEVSVDIDSSQAIKLLKATQVNLISSVLKRAQTLDQSLVTKNKINSTLVHSKQQTMSSPKQQQRRLRFRSSQMY